MPLPKAVICNWDGTLVANSLDHAYQAMRATFEYYEVEPPTLAVFLAEISISFSAFCRNHGIPKRANWLQPYVIYEQYFLEHLDDLELRDGAREALAYCHDLRIMTALVSGTPPEKMFHNIKRMSIATLIDHVEAGGYNSNRERLLSAFSYIPTCARLYVGSTTKAIVTAKALGMKTVGIPGCFESSEDSLRANADSFIARLHDLIPLLENQKGEVG